MPSSLSKLRALSAAIVLLFTFALPAADGAVHSIDVKVDRSGAAGKSPTAAYRVDHRSGYQAPKE